MIHVEFKLLFPKNSMPRNEWKKLVQHVDDTDADSLEWEIENKRIQIPFASSSGNIVGAVNSIRTLS